MCHFEEFVKPALHSGAFSRLTQQCSRTVLTNGVKYIGDSIDLGTRFVAMIGFTHTVNDIVNALGVYLFFVISGHFFDTVRQIDRGFYSISLIECR